MSTTSLTPPAGCLPQPARPPLDLARLLGPAAWQRLPAATRRRFAAGHADAVYEGRMSFDCSTLGRCFALGALLIGAPLVARRAERVRATVSVAAGREGGVTWHRRLRWSASQATRVVQSTKTIDPSLGLIERTRGGLTMALQVSEEAGALFFTSSRYFFTLGRWKLPLPDLLTPGRCRVGHHDLGRGRFRFTLEMTHPWWGCTFRQEGVFVDREGVAE